MNQSQLSVMLPTHLCGQSQCRAVLAGTAIANTATTIAPSYADASPTWRPRPDLRPMPHRDHFHFKPSPSLIMGHARCSSR